jgi:hypothetical protein
VRASLRQLIFAPFLIVAGFSLLFAFQNCSGDVAFESQPSNLRPPQQFFENDIRPDGFIVGGDSEVIIRFNETPGDRTVDDGDGVIDYEVITPGTRPIQIRCTLNGVVVDCGSAGRIPVPITQPGEGEFIIEVITEQNPGRVVIETIDWTVYRRIAEVSKIINIDTVSDKVDIIINVDNSGSMEFEQRSMASRISSFMESFSGLDYHIGITTTSPIGDDVVWKESLPYVDGKFVDLDGSGNFCIRKDRHSYAQAQSLIQSNVVRDLYLRDDNGEIMINEATGQPYPEGNGWERGIFTTYRSIERYQTANSPESRCLRPDVAKHVIIISDERETLTDNSGQPLFQIEKSDGDNLRQLFASVFPGTIFKWHSIIVNPFSPEGEACLASHGAKPGIEYAHLSRKTGGVIGSVCAEDYGAQLGRIGQLVRDSRLSYQLDCVSVTSGAPQGRVVNLSDQSAVGVNFRFIGDKVEFAEPLSPGRYQVIHYCYQ